MIIILPLLPIALFLFFLAVGIVGEIQSHITTISNVIFIIALVIFAIIAIRNLLSSVSTTRKVLSSIFCVALGGASSYLLKWFVLELGAIELGILGLIEFVFTLIVGGAICLLIYGGCMYFCCWLGD